MSEPNQPLQNSWQLSLPTETRHQDTHGVSCKLRSRRNVRTCCMRRPLHVKPPDAKHIARSIPLRVLGCKASRYLGSGVNVCHASPMQVATREPEVVHDVVAVCIHVCIYVYIYICVCVCVPTYSQSPRLGRPLFLMWQLRPALTRIANAKWHSVSLQGQHCTPRQQCVRAPHPCLRGSLLARSCPHPLLIAAQDNCGGHLLE